MIGLEKIRITLTDTGKVVLVSNLPCDDVETKIEVWGTIFENGFQPINFKQLLKFPNEAKEDIYKIIDR